MPFFIVSFKLSKMRPSQNDSREVSTQLGWLHRIRKMHIDCKKTEATFPLNNATAPSIFSVVIKQATVTWGQISHGLRHHCSHFQESPPLSRKPFGDFIRSFSFLLFSHQLEERLDSVSGLPTLSYSPTALVPEIL